MIKAKQFAAALWVLTACDAGEGPVGSATSFPDAGIAGDSDALSCEPGEIKPGPSPVRRMTRVEYNNTIFQLLGDTSSPADAFSPDQEALGFTNQASALVVSSLLAEQYTNAAEDVTRRNLEQFLVFMPSCADGANEASCQVEFDAWLPYFGRKAFRRPLTANELDEFTTLFETGATLGDVEYDPRTGLELVVQAMLQSPQFLYRVEFGDAEAEVAEGIVQLTSYEMASRLSFLFWNSMPDDILLEAAEKDELREPDQIEKHARRLLAAGRAREAVKTFHREWLKLNRIEQIRSVGKDEEIYPDYDDSLLPLFQREAEAFFDYAIFEEDASLSTLFTAPFSMMNKELADFYGVSGPKGEEFEKVELDPTRYSGFLTQPGLLALYAKADRSSPIHRGKFVRSAILCQVPPPPPDVVPEPPDVDTSLTTREQFTMHESEEVCAGCHRLIDPIGLGFEHFDGLGRYRETEWGLSIDASGEVIDGGDASGKFDGVQEMAEQLANSEQVRDCVVTQWFRYGYGRGETPEDACSIDTLRKRFKESKYDVKELMIALTTTDAFRYRKLDVTKDGP